MMRLRFLLLAALLGSAGFWLADAQHVSASYQERNRSLLVARWGLTDLFLAGEARHSRHPSMATAADALGTGPGQLDLFPSGALIAPPPQLRAARP